MSFSEKIKTINKKIEHNKAQYSLDKQTAKISALWSGNASKYEFLTGKDILPEKNLLWKAAALKRVKYSLLRKELKAQTVTAKKQYQKLDNTDEFDKIIEKENYSKSSLIYDSNHSLYKCYRNREKIYNISFKSKYSFIERIFWWFR